MPDWAQSIHLSSGVLGRAIEQYIFQLGHEVEEAQRRLMRDYAAAWKESQRELERLWARWDAAEQRGERISPAWLYQEGRLTEVQRVIAEAFTKRQQYFTEGMRSQFEEIIRVVADNQLNMVRAQQPEPLPGQRPDEPDPSSTGAIYSVWNRPDERAAERAAGAFVEGSPLHRLFLELGTSVPQAAEEVMVTGSLLGQSSKVIARELRRKAGIGLSRSMTIARTETNRFSRQATREIYSQNTDVVRAWTWSAALGPNTCIACWSMHGREFPITEVLTDHPNGRCAMVPLTRSWRDLGVEGIAETQFHAERAEARFDRLPLEMKVQLMGKARFLAFLNGDIPWDDLVMIKTDPKWGTMPRTRSLLSQLGAEKRAFWIDAAQGKEKLPWSLRQRMSKNKRRELKAIYGGRLRWETKPPEEPGGPPRRPGQPWKFDPETMGSIVRSPTSAVEPVGWGVYGAERWYWPEGSMVVKAQRSEGDPAALEDPNRAIVETMAYEINRSLGFNLVPPTTMTKVGENYLRSYQEWVEDGKLTHELAPGPLQNQLYAVGPSGVIHDMDLAKQQAQMKMLDYLLTNLDRHGGNYLYIEGENRLVAIDHGLGLISNYGDGQYDLGAKKLTREELRKFFSDDEIAYFNTLTTPEAWLKLWREQGVMSRYGDIMTPSLLEDAATRMSDRMRDQLGSLSLAPPKPPPTKGPGAGGMTSGGHFRTPYFTPGGGVQFKPLSKPPKPEWYEVSSLSSARNWLKERNVQVGPIPKNDPRRLNWAKSFTLVVDKVEQVGFEFDDLNLLMGVRDAAGEKFAQTNDPKRVGAWFTVNHGKDNKNAVFVNTNAYREQYAAAVKGRPVPERGAWTALSNEDLASGPSTVLHEVGHAFHRQALGRKWFDQKNVHTWDPEVQEDHRTIAKKVSLYAASSPAEFVAETFTLLVEGFGVDEDVMSLYKFYKGPEPPNGWPKRSRYRTF